MSKHRLFVAVPLAPAIIEEALRIQQALKAGASDGARWLPPEQFHLTIHFIGDVTDEEIPLLRARLGASRSVRPCVQVLDRWTGFPSSRRATVGVLAAETAEPPLARLRRQTGAAIARCGLPVEDRSFVPHVTLARFRRPTRLEGASPAPLAVAVDRFRLYESRLDPKAAHYEMIEEFVLAAPGSP